MEEDDSDDFVTLIEALWLEELFVCDPEAELDDFVIETLRLEELSEDLVTEML